MGEFVAAFSGYSSDNIEASKVFYKETLGLNVEESMGGINFSVNGQRVFIYPKQDHVPAAYTVLNLVTNDIDSMVDELVQRGVEFERYEGMPGKQDERGVLRGKDVHMGPNIAWFKDPSGNILGLVEE